MDSEFPRIKRLPPYVFSVINDLKMQMRRSGRDIVDFGMGNPDQAAPAFIIDKLVEVARRDNTHRYSVSRGVPRLLRAICNWYRQRYDVNLDPETEAIVTLGSKEGLAHLALAVVDKGDAVLVPNPSYPIHPFGYVIAGADVHYIPIGDDMDFFSELEKAVRDSWPRPKLLLVNFPSNPTTQCVDLDFLTRLVEFARSHGVWLVQDLAYADIVFDGYTAPSIMQAPGAREVAVEFFTLSKSYNMPGWRVGFMVGNHRLVDALARLKSYLDYGLFTPIQVAAITALEEGDQAVADIRHTYQRRRDVLCEGLQAAGWPVKKPRATMFLWAAIPSCFRDMGSLEFSRKLLLEAGVAVAPGVGFGSYGEGYVRFALIENEHRTRQATRSIRQLLRRYGGPEHGDQTPCRQSE